MLAKGQKINERYEIIKTIGEGGMANVYLAKDTILDRKVAVKVLRGDLSSDEKFIRRFQREALSVSNLSHPNIVEVYDVGEEDGQYYIVMEYIEGKTLKQLINKRGALTIPEVIDIMSQLTDGLAHAHEAYIIHRDIKPQNIMILDDGGVKITDFGIAVAMNATQLTQTNSVMGTVHYLPPEQANGKSATVKSDIYSLGILMYELLTGSVPFKGDNAVEIALKHMKDKLPSIRKQNPLIPQSIENIILKACAKNPRNRYDSVKQMHEDIVHAMENQNEKKYVYSYPENDLDETKKTPIIEKPKKTVEPPTEDEIENEEYNPNKDSKRNKIILILSIVLLSLLLIGAILALVITSGGHKDIKVPDVTDIALEKAIQKLEKAGFKYTTEEEASDEIEKGNVIRTKPAAGSTRKKGSTITIVESIGSKSYEVEDLTGKNYAEVKAKLELLKINVKVEKKTVEDKSKYKGKEDTIIDQDPKYNKDNKKILEEGDTITLYIPDIAEAYPDMVGEKWTLDDVQSFADEYNITLDVTEEESDEEEGTVIYQNRPAGDPIINGVTLRIKVAIPKKTTEEDDDPLKDVVPNNDANTTTTDKKKDKKTNN